MQRSIRTSWDDLLGGIDAPGQWMEKYKKAENRFLTLLRAEAAPEPPRDPQVEVEGEWQSKGFRIQYISYAVEEDRRAHAYLATGRASPPGGFPGAVCLQGTTEWGAMGTLDLRPAPDDVQGQKPNAGRTDARNLVRHGYVTQSPEHFC